MYISVDQAVKILLQGGIVAFPTETVYGLGAVATNKNAVEKIFQAKQRPADNPLICHFFSVTQIRKYVEEITPAAKVLFKAFSPGPLSIMLSLPPDSHLLTATRGNQSVICRIPDHPEALKLIKKLGYPIAAPSANLSGRPSATIAEMVENYFGNAIDGIIDGDASVIGLESTIVDCRKKNEVTILRPGVIGKKELEAAFAEAKKEGSLKEKVVVKTSQTNKETTPGSKYKHYAPRTPIERVTSIEQIPNGKETIAILGTEEKFREKDIPCIQNPPFPYEKGIHYICLGSKNELEPIAQNLYRHLHELDKLDVPQAYLVEEEWGDSSIGRAIANRLEKIAI